MEKKKIPLAGIIALVLGIIGVFASILSINNELGKLINYTGKSAWDKYLSDNGSGAIIILIISIICTIVGICLILIRRKNKS